MLPSIQRKRGPEDVNNSPISISLPSLSQIPLR